MGDSWSGMPSGFRACRCVQGQPQDNFFAVHWGAWVGAKGRLAYQRMAQENALPQRWWTEGEKYRRELRRELRMMSELPRVRHG